MMHNTPATKSGIVPVLSFETSLGRGFTAEDESARTLPRLVTLPRSLSSLQIADILIMIDEDPSPRSQRSCPIGWIFRIDLI